MEAHRFIQPYRLRIRTSDRETDRAAVQRHGQDAGNRRFANASMARKDVAVRNSILAKRIQERAGHMVLAGHVRKALRTVFSRQYLIAHCVCFSQWDCNGLAEGVFGHGGGKRARQGAQVKEG